MAWPVLVLVLCLGWSRTVWTDCAAQCSACTVQGPNMNTRVNPLVCSLECEGSLLSSAEWETCKKVLSVFMPSLPGTDRQTRTSLDASSEGEEVPKEQPSSLTKRYGGFMKKLEKTKAFASAVMRENGVANKGGPAKKYGSFLRKFDEREAPDTAAEATARNGGELADYRDSAEEGPRKDEWKRYGGFLRKYPKRSPEPAEDAEHLHKRYGGFMRRIRPKLKWDNEKRYGGFLRRQFKVTARAEEDPSAFSGEIAAL